MIRVKNYENSKIVKCPINTCMILRNDDVIVTIAVFARRETQEFIMPLLCLQIRRI